MSGFLDDIPNIDLPASPAPRARRDKPATAKIEPVARPVIYMKVRCPCCKSTNCPVTNSANLPIRYHKCRECGFNFKSVEK
ncbi:MAG: hypothetical protein ABII09_03645 [Planctomycetota bacterium]